MRSYVYRQRGVLFVSTNANITKLSFLRDDTFRKISALIARIRIIHT